LSVRLVTLDTSAAVKWFLDEAGSDEVRGLLGEFEEGRIQLVLASHVVVECIAVAVRAFGSAEAGRRFWAFVGGLEVPILPSDAILLEAALAQVDARGCDFYDAFAPAVAELADAELWSADSRAHAAIDGVVLVGC
jgi:predicted nucleic acid-binding protein